MQNLFIYGASDLAKLAHYYAEKERGINVLGFIVDDDFYNIEEYIGLPVFTWNKLPNIENIKIFVAIGYKNMRARVSAYSKVKQNGYECVNLVSPHSCIAKNVQMGDNNIIMAGAVIEPFVNLGSNNIIWSNATICHDTQLGNHNFFAANVTVGGKVTIGNNCFLGFSSTVTQNLTVGNEVLLAAGSVALATLKGLSMYAGSPATFKKAINPDLGITIA